MVIQSEGPHATRSGPAALGFGAAAIGVAGAAAVLGLVAAWRGSTYWNFSDGVYALSARLWLHGAVPYHDFAAAQPPLVYGAGAALLGVHDSVSSLRLGLTLIDLLTACLVMVAVWRLARNRGLAITSAVAAPLMPMSLHESGLLTPETLGAPLLLGAALLVSRPRFAAIGGALGALAGACKLAFLLPALAAVLATRSRRPAFLGLLIASAIGWAIFLIAFGSSLWTNVVTAQLQVGGAPLHYVAGLWAQAAWLELALCAGAIAALLLSSRGNDRALISSLAATAAGALLLTASVAKRGSYINSLAIAEPALLALAAPGALWVAAAAREGVDRARAGLLPLGAAGALLLAQVGSLLLNPSDPRPYTRPFAASGPRRILSAREVRDAVRIARRCEPGSAYSGVPYLAFLANRRMPGGQPDTFIIAFARADGRFYVRANADLRRCPLPPPVFATH